MFLDVWSAFRQNRPALLGLGMVTAVILAALLAPWAAPEDPARQLLVERRAAPSWHHPFGLDGFGRDILSRVIYGSRRTLLAGLGAVLLSAVFGSVLGLFAGYRGGFGGAVIMRLMDLMLSFPYFLLAILIVAAAGPDLRNAVIAVAIAYIPMYARVVRGATLEIRRAEFIDAAQAVGSRDLRIAVSHVLPNIAAPIMVLSTVGMATAIIAIASLSFLGLGAQPPSAEWGAMLAEARTFITSDPHIAFFPGLAILWTVLGFNLLGDGLRDVFDPRGAS